VYGRNGDVHIFLQQINISVRCWQLVWFGVFLNGQISLSSFPFTSPPSRTFLSSQSNGALPALGNDRFAQMLKNLQAINTPTIQRYVSQIVKVS
jgi:hypothetical protein